MKFIILQIIAILLMLSNPAKAAQIQEVRVVDDGVQIDVVYSGGCKEHKFSLKPMVCTRSVPQSCAVQLVDEGQDDTCRASISETIHFSATELPLNTGAHELIFVDSAQNLTVVNM